VLAPATRGMDSAARAALWHRLLSRFFVWGSIGLAITVASGIAIVQLRFGGFSSVPAVHRWNMIVGLPAIALFAYAQLGPWRACRRAITRGDWTAADHSVARIRRLFGIVLTLGLVASIASAAGRFG
jgi:uncharacterized membrane protein